jgi:hypothetical protein
MKITDGWHSLGSCMAIVGFQFTFIVSRSALFPFTVHTSVVDSAMKVASYDT